ncbi:VOC family protein [Vagococcus carniphilus]|uniref:VOC family protein n=1 Tax=Vagococcus carniphilus TaxID=218144 RepID=UPI003B5A171C
MINQVDIMLYVKDVKEAANFWQKGFGITEVETIDLPESFISIKLTLLNQVSLQLFDKAFIQQFSPEVAMNTPSLLFKTDKVEALHQQLKQISPFVSEITNETGTKQFHFSDKESNYFAVMADK